MGFKFGSKSLKELEGVSPKLVELCHAVIAKTPMDFGVHDGSRTAQEQNALYRRGASQRDGYNRKSEHQKQEDGYGHAVDLVPYFGGRLRWEWPLIYPIAATVAREADRMGLKLVWGGVWDRKMGEYGFDEQDMKKAVYDYTVRHPGPDFIDGPHYELA